MKPLKEFVIPFAGLKEGVHHYTFKVTDAFFEHFENSQVTQANLSLEVEFNKLPSMFTLSFFYSGSIPTFCDRCGEAFDFQVNDKDILYVKFGEVPTPIEEHDEVIVIAEEEYEIDISHYIYEFVNLSIPLKKTHLEGDCDPAVLERLHRFNAEQLNKGKEQEENIDPRWEALKALKTKNIN